MGRARAVAAWVPALVLVGGGMTLAAVVAVPEDQEAATRALFPLDTGTTWVYAVTDHDRPSGTHTKQVAERGRLVTSAGDLVTGVARLVDHYTDYPGTGARTTATYLASNGHRIDEYGVIATDHQLQELDPPAKVYDDIPVGDSWAYQGTLAFQDFTFRTKVTERGSVTAGGRTFEGCTRSETTIPVALADQPGAVEVLDEWTCPGYGAVLTTDRLDALDIMTTEELVEFHGDAGNWVSVQRSTQDAGTADAEVTTLGFDGARTYSVADGSLSADLAWTIGRDTAGDTPPVSAGSLMVSGDGEGWVSATDVRTGEQVWQVRLTPPILTTPAVAGDAVLVADAQKRIRALALADGSTRWVHDFDDVVSATPAVGPAAVVVATDDSTVTALDPTDGSTLWTTTLGGTLTAPPALDGDRVFVCDGAGDVTALSLADGSREWTRTAAEGTLTGPTVADGRVLARDEDGIVYAFDADDGRLEWESRTRTRDETSVPLAVSGGVVVALLDVRDMVGIDLADGNRLWERSVDLTQTAPVVVGDDVVTVSTAGRVSTWNLRSGAPGNSFDLPRQSPGLAPTVKVQPALVDGALVITSTPNASPAQQTTYAYAVDHTHTAGVLLGLSAREIPTVPSEPVTVLPDGDLLVPGFDGSVSRVGADGHDTEVVRNDERIATAGVVTGDEVVVRRDDQLEAVPLDGGDARWSITVGNAFAGSRPAVANGTVYAGTSDGRFIAVDVDDGSIRWSAPVDPDLLPKPPLVLSDGDVVYGVGLARYDAATGHVVWSEPGTTVLGSPVESGGLVIGAALLGDGTSGLAAWDADTGRQAWFVAGTPDSYVGPAVAGGTVVWADGAGVVHALDARTGTETWSLDLHRPVGGVPVIRDGRVYVATLGRPEDLDQRDYRVLALDLRTGRFGGSWEPPTTQNWIVPPVSAGAEDDALLVPTAFTGSTQIVGVGPRG